MSSQNDSPDQIEQTPPDKPEGYIFSAIPTSQKQAISSKAEARVRQTCKSAVHAYLQSYMDKDGPRRHLLEDAAPFSVQFETGISGAEDPDNPLAIKVQLARKWTSLRKMLPAVIIIDNGYEAKSSGMGGLQQGRRIPRENGDTDAIIVQTVMAKITLQLMVGAIGETDASDLCEVVRYILMELTTFTRGHVITPGVPSDRWEVRLPLIVGMEGLEQQVIEGDQRDSFWSSSISLEVDFEGEIQHAINHPANPGTREVYHNSSHGNATVLEAPDVMTLHERPRLRVLNMPPWTRVVSDDMRTATINENLVVFPKRMGTFNILVLRDAPGDTQPVVLVKKSVTIAPM